MTNDLGPIAELIAKISCDANRSDGAHIDQKPVDITLLKMLCSKARDAWAFAVSGPHPDESLRRRFTHQMTILSDLTDRAGAGGVDGEAAAELLALADHLFTCHQRFLQQDTRLPRAVVLDRVKGWQEELSLIKEMTWNKISTVSLRLVLDEMLKEIYDLRCGKPCTVGSLRYTETFISEISFILQNSSCGHAEDQVFNKLITLNFNHIRFFLCLEDRLRSAASNLTAAETLVILRHQKHFFKQLNPCMAYAANWNSIGEMMHSWIQEEIDLMSKESSRETALTAIVLNKLGFNLSVAQLACLTKVFYKTGIYMSENIGEVFEFSARYFCSKKQENISKNSFSKEYYSISQKTAANILYLLQKMTATVRHDYFP